MKRKIISIAIVIIVFAVAFIALSGNTAPASAKPADTYTIDWYTIDNGGVTDNSISGGGYILNGTIGQFDAGNQNGSNYKLSGGFWGFLDSLRSLYLPLIVR